LLAAAVAFVYFVLAGPSVVAPIGGLTGALFGLIASREARGYAKARVPAQQPALVPQPARSY
jgi:hypothetical protein